MRVAANFFPALLSLSLSLSVCAPSARAEELPGKLTLSQAGARARAARRALVVEMGASWCGPCKLLEQKVLPQPQVQRALQAVLFIRYDAEVGAGIAAARTLRIRSFPTLLALAQDGSEIDRLQGVPGAADLARWLAQVAQESESTEVLQARARTHPEDGRNLLTLAQRLRKLDRPADSRRALELALKAAAGKDEAVASEADWALRMLHVQDVLREEPRRAMIEHLRAYPRGRMADTALWALSRLGPADPEARQALGRYVDAHMEPGQEEALNQAIYACLRAAAYDEAERGARRLLQADGKNAMYLDTMAEVLHLRGDSAAAVRLAGEALSLLSREEGDKAARELRAELSSNQARFRRGKKEPPADFVRDNDEPFPWEQF